MVEIGDKQEIGAHLTSLRFARVIPFTKAENFNDKLEEVFNIIRQQLSDDQSRYSQDWSTTGLPGIANGIVRKASRIFDLLVLGMSGKDKPEDEFRDNLMLAIYGYIYYMMSEDIYQNERK